EASFVACPSTRSVVVPAVVLYAVNCTQALTKVAPRGTATFVKRSPTSWLTRIVQRARHQRPPRAEADRVEQRVPVVDVAAAVGGIDDAQQVGGLVQEDDAPGARVVDVVEVVPLAVGSANDQHGLADDHLNVKLGA